MMGFGVDDDRRGGAALPEGEHAERAARRVVQWELSSSSRVGVVLGIFLVLLVAPVGGGVAVVGGVAWEVVAGLALQSGLIVVFGVIWAHHLDRSRRVFMTNDVEAILRAFSVTSIRARKLALWRAAERGGLAVSGLCVIGLAMIWLIPGLSEWRDPQGGFSVVAVMVRGAISGLLPAILTRMWLWSGGNDAEIEDHRRKVLGEDWFAG